MLRPWLFVGFSGHRKLANPALIDRVLRDVLKRLQERSSDPLAAVSSAAAGADTIFAEAVAAMELPWTVLLPFPVAEFRKDFADDPEGWARVERLLPLAVRTVIEPPPEARSEAYLEAGVRTVDECDVLIVVWNGEEAAGRGGTGDVVAYGRSQQVPIIWIHAETGAVVEEGMERLPQAGEPRRENVVTTTTTSSGRRTINGREILEASFRHHADAARRLRPRAVNFNLALVIMHQVSVALTLTMLIWYDTWLPGPAGVAKFAILTAAFILPWFLQRAHGDWLNHRLRSEIFRSAAAIWPLPNPEDILPELRLPTDERTQRSILLLRLLSPAPAVNVLEAREGYARHATAPRAHVDPADARDHRHRTNAVARSLGMVCARPVRAQGLTGAFPFFRLSLLRPVSMKRILTLNRT
jgi:hypothetical protein